jgi:hypothetical protein
MQGVDTKGQSLPEGPAIFAGLPVQPRAVRRARSGRATLYRRLTLVTKLTAQPIRRGVGVPGTAADRSDSPGSRQAAVTNGWAGQLPAVLDLAKRNGLPEKGAA